MSHICFRGDAFLSTPIGSSWNNRYFIDTEFTSFERCQLISLAIVGENGHEFYGECTDFDRSLCSEFVRASVLPQLEQIGERAWRFSELSKVLHAWIDCIPVSGRPVLCYDLDVDIELLRDLLGEQLPLGWTLECITSRIDNRRRAIYYARHGGEHHALHDARAVAQACTL